MKYAVWLTAFALAFSPLDAFAQDSLEQGEAGVSEYVPPADAVLPAVRVGVGASASLRSLFVNTSELGSDPAYFEHTPPPYLGGMLDVQIRLGRFADGRGAIGLWFEGRYGATRDASELPAVGRTPLTDHTLGLGALTLARKLRPNTELRVDLGVQGTSFIITDPNPIYTGHRYLTALAGVSLTQTLGGVVPLTLRAMSLPNIATNESGGAGGGAQTFGVRAGADLGVYLMRTSDSALDLTLRYDYQRFRTQYRDNTRYGENGGVTEDDQHLLSVLLCYAL
ncbi:MAG: hypothetical protein AAGI01_10980 [Myxococcota bacterium]